METEKKTEIEEIKVGDRVRLTNGDAREWTVLKVFGRVANPVFKLSGTAKKEPHAPIVWKKVRRKILEKIQ
jgi:hypothetical protein